MTTPLFQGERPLRIEEEMRSAYLDYAMSVIVSRALPDVRDGLKPVHRRILYAMHELGLAPNQPYKKSARIVGEVLGKYHPHGDAPVYDALVRMAQDFSMRCPLVDGQGNFGSVDDDPPAAMRYTEARLASIAQEMLVDIERETVDFTANFDGSLDEPVVLPARLPNLLVNGASGIAVGMTTNIPPHNLREVGRAIIHLIDHPEASLTELMQLVPGPDFPTHGIIRGGDGIREAYTSGRGRIVIEARAEVVEAKRPSRPQIIITELPYQVNKASLVKKIATVAKERRVEGITDVRDESDREGIRVVVELSRDTDPEYVLRNLYKHTPLRTAFHVNMLALVDGAPRVVNLKQLLSHYINFRREVTERRARYDLRKARERAHLLEGLRIAITNLDEVIAIIRGADDTETARTALIDRFDLTHPQAQAILDMQLRRLSSLERQKLEEEYRELLARIADLEALLADSAKVLTRVKEETRELVEKHGDQRRTQIDVEELRELSAAELVQHQWVVVLLTQRGYVKRMPLDTFRKQHRGGKGVLGLQTRDGDRIQHLHIGDTHDLLLFFTNKGRVYSLDCFRLPHDESRTSKGKPLVNMIPIQPHERVQAVMTVKEVGSQGSLVMATRRGRAKRLQASFFQNIRSSGIICMDLKEGDEVVSVRPAQETDDVLVFTRNGKGVRFSVTTLRELGRYAGGVKGIRLLPGDYVVSMNIGVKGGRVLTVTERGYGKFTPLASFPTKGRATQGVVAHLVNERTGKLAAALVVSQCEELVAISSKNKVIRTPVNTIRSLGRNTQGVRIMDLDEDATVVSVDCWEAATDAPEPAKPAPASAPARSRNGHQLTLELEAEASETDDPQVEGDEGSNETSADDES